MVNWMMRTSITASTPSIEWGPLHWISSCLSAICSGSNQRINTVFHSKFPPKLAHTGFEPEKADKQAEIRCIMRSAAIKSDLDAGMVSRSAAISERRAAREKRREERLREKERVLAEEEEGRRRAEKAAKEAAAQRRREERRMAKQKEMECLERQQLLAELNSKATAHYCRTLLRRRGVAPWREFVEQCRADRQGAERLRVQLLLRRCVRDWRGRCREVVAEKERKAKKLHESILIARTWRAWRKVSLVSYIIYTKHETPIQTLKQQNMWVGEGLRMHAP